MAHKHEYYIYEGDQEARYDDLTSKGMDPQTARAKLGIKAVQGPEKPSGFTVPADSPGEIYRSTFPKPDALGVEAAHRLVEQGIDEKFAKKVADGDLTPNEAAARKIVEQARHQ
jgi:hypothetical protein